MRLPIKATLAGALLTFTSLSHAEPYLGVTGTASEYSGYDNVDHGYGFHGFGGYRFESVPLMIEAGYLETGNNRANDFYGPGVPAVLSFKGEQFSLGYFGRVDRNGSGVLAKLGYFTGKNREKTLDLSSNDNGLSWDVGYDWMFLRNLGLRADIGGLVGVHDFSTADHKSNVVVAGLGLIFSFGGSELESSFHHRRSYVAPAPVYYAPQPPPPPPPAAAPYGATAAAPAYNGIQPGAQANAVAGAVIRRQPSSSATAAAVLKNGGPVTLGTQRVDNADGSWWYVTSNSGLGWVNEKELQPLH